MTEVITTSILQGFELKNSFFEEWPWFKFNNLGLALGMALKFYTNVAKRLKLKIRKFWDLLSTFVDVTGEKLVWWEGEGWGLWVNFLIKYWIIYGYRYISL